MSERIAAAQALLHLEQQLHYELTAEGGDVAAAACVEDDGDTDELQEVQETGYVDEKGELRRPWCPATRILEHREMVSSALAADGATGQCERLTGSVWHTVQDLCAAGS